jgi:hypothetical protein
VLRLGKIEVLSACARYRAPNARALLIIGFNTLLLKQNLKAEICVQVNFGLNCSFFCDSVKNNGTLKDQKSNIPSN